MVMVQLDGGLIVFGGTQFLPWYYVLLHERNVSSLNDLKMEERTFF